MIHFEILGIPKPKQSARFRIMKNKAGKNFVGSYQKKEVKDNEANIAWSVQQQLPEGFVPYDCPIGMRAEYIFPPPSSMNKKQRIMIENGEKIWKHTAPDVQDNLSKGTIDALAGVVFTVDSRIVTMCAEKYYGLVPKTILEFWEV